MSKAEGFDNDASRLLGSVVEDYRDHLLCETIRIASENGRRLATCEDVLAGRDAIANRIPTQVPSSLIAGPLQSA